MGIGLQHKTVDELVGELDLVSSQLLGLFNRIIRRFTQFIDQVLEKAIEENFETSEAPIMKPVQKTLEDDLAKTEKVRINY